VLGLHACVSLRSDQTQNVLDKGRWMPHGLLYTVGHGCSRRTNGLQIPTMMIFEAPCMLGKEHGWENWASGFVATAGRAGC
jgi:hypothetical protein